MSIRYISVSKIGFDLIIQNSGLVTGDDGLEYVPNSFLYNMYKKSLCGGFLSANFAGKHFEINNIYKGVAFDHSKTQSLYMPSDVKSCYGSVLLEW